MAKRAKKRVCCPKGARRVTRKGKLVCKKGKKRVKRLKSCR